MSRIPSFVRRWRGVPFTALLISSASLLVGPTAGVAESEVTRRWSGELVLEGRWFPDEGVQGQPRENLSLSIEPELDVRWDEGDQLLRFVPFVRLDQQDEERSHFDLRELYWQRVWRSWELAVGVRELFWGVTESVHLVDIVNQTDLVEDLDGEQKLGQPMVQASWIGRRGTLDLFLLAGFRERTFPGEDGRLRGEPVVDTDRPLYESSSEDDHVDWALRWSHSVGPFDLGVYHFEGTGRDPDFVSESTDSGGVLRPFYGQIEQTGLDVQATLGPWLLKLEAIHRQNSRESFEALVGGFEFTFFDLAGSGADVGLLAEYFEDGRWEAGGVPPGAQPPTLFVGTRLALNDVQSTELLVGAAQSLEDDTLFLNVEGSRRLGSSWRLILRSRSFLGTDPLHPFAPLRRDDYLQLGLSRFF